MDIIWLILWFIRATKENNFELHLTALHELCPLVFTYSHYNYSRYMPACLVTMLNLSDTHPGALELFRSNGFSASRSTVPLSRNPVDITFEQIRPSTTMPNHMVASLASVGTILLTRDGALLDISVPNMLKLH